MDQWMQLVATVEQDIGNALNSLIAQEVSFVDHILGINPSSPNPSPNAAAAQPSSGGGQGSGSGSGTTTTGFESGPGIGNIMAKPMTGGGGGGGGTSGTGGGTSGTGSGSGSGPHSGSAVVTGPIWLDNNGDGALDENEMDYSGATVSLFQSWDGGQTWISGGPNTTNGSLEGNNYSIQVGFPLPNNILYKVQVAAPNCVATIPGALSVLNAQGFSPVFGLANGQVKVVPGGLRSMNVTTTADDPNGVLQQNTITLRDAINTGNNGPPFSAVTFDGPPGGPGVTGTITLSDNLPHIKKSYNVTGPGKDTLTVNGGGYEIFFLESNNISTISGLGITGGSGDEGGGVYSSGNLTLDNDSITNNLALTDGGGVYNAAGSTMTMKYSTISNNTTTGSGGGIRNQGLLKIYGSEIYSNDAHKDGGVVANRGIGTIYILDGSSIYNNTASDSGGGIFNSGSSAIVTEAWIKNNSAGGSGGGVYSNKGSLTLAGNDSINNNTASNGGGISLFGDGKAKMTGGAVTSNNATALDGFVGQGGGIFVYLGNLTLSGGVSVSRNKISGGNGGGIYVDVGGTVTVSGGTIQFNTAKYDWNGGGIYNGGGVLTLKGGVYVGTGNSANQGGGMYLANGSNTTFDGVTVSGNTASNGGDGIYLQTGGNVIPTDPGPPKLNDYDDPNNKPFKGP
jgi:hypothetical protein